MRDLESAFVRLAFKAAIAAFLVPPGSSEWAARVNVNALNVNDDTTAAALLLLPATVSPTVNSPVVSTLMYFPSGL